MSFEFRDPHRRIKFNSFRQTDGISGYLGEPLLQSGKMCNALFPAPRILGVAANALNIVLCEFADPVTAHNS